MLTTHPDGPSAATPSPEHIRAAFRDLHGRSLHGFALLLTLGDRSNAARLAGEALAGGMDEVDRLHHPERAAAWLRARVVSNATHIASRRPRAIGFGAVALAELSAFGPVVAGLAALGRTERAALIAADIEGFDLRDVETVVGVDGSDLRRLLERARSRYGRAFSREPHDPLPSGPIAERLGELARQALI